MTLTMYLGLEGVVCARRDVRRYSRSELAEPRLNTLPLMHTIVRLVSGREDLAIVLNSWLVVDYGYRGILNLLPNELACRAVGATMQGNRVHRRRITLPRVEILRRDIARREPTSLIIVESARSAIPFEHLERAVVVEGTSEKEQAYAAGKVAQLLTNVEEPLHHEIDTESESRKLK